MARSSVPLVALLALLAPAASLIAAPINYGNQVGTSFTYLQVTEDSSTDATPLFGAPTVTGNALSFNPVSFGSNSTGGAFDITDGTLTSTILSTVNGVGIDKISFAEAGDYTLAGTGTASTTATVNAAFFIRITQTAAGPITPITFSQNLAFSPSGGTFNLISDPGIAVIWNGSILVDVSAILLSHGITDLATRVDFTLDNQLVTFSEANTISYIKKKEVGGVTLEAFGGGDIPEPGSLSLLAVGTLALLLRKRA